jgi:hypothetical protein
VADVHHDRPADRSEHRWGIAAIILNLSESLIVQPAPATST